MHSETTDIEQLFSKKFEKYEVKSSDQDWLDLSARLGRVNFLKFSIVTFNIYYLVVIVALAGTTTFLGIKNYQMAQKIRHFESSFESNVDKRLNKEVVNRSEIQKAESVFKSEPDPQISNSSVTTSSRIEEIEKNTAKSGIQKKHSIDSKAQINDQEVSTELEKQHDAEIKNLKSTESDNKPDSVSQPSIKRVIKKTYIIKQKTVIVKDTVVVKKNIN